MVLSLILVIILSTVGVASFFVPQDIGNSSQQSPDSLDSGDLNLDTVRDRYIDYINEERTKRGLSELTVHSNLTKSAQGMSDLMALKDFVGHTTPSGKSPIQRIQDAGGFKGDNACGSETPTGESSSASENVLQTAYNKKVGTNYKDSPVNYKTEEELARGMVQLFLASPSHKSTLLQSSFDLHGVGITVDENNKVYLSHKFCEK